MTKCLKLLAKEVLEEAIANEMTIGALARDLGISRGHIFASSKKHGINFPMLKSQVKNMQQIRDVTSTMSSDDAVDYLMDCLSYIFEDQYAESNILISLGLELTRGERNILYALIKKTPELCTSEYLHVVYSGINNETNSNIVKVVISRIRKKIANEPFQILNIHGIGYRLVKDEGYNFPWEEEKNDGK